MYQKKLKILTIFGTRPEVIKLFPVLKALNEDANIESKVVSTSQHREMIEDLFIMNEGIQRHKCQCEPPVFENLGGRIEISGRTGDRQHRSSSPPSYSHWNGNCSCFR